MSRGVSLRPRLQLRRHLVGHPAQLLVHPGDRLVHRRLRRRAAAAPPPRTPPGTGPRAGRRRPGPPPAPCRRSAARPPRRRARRRRARSGRARRAARGSAGTKRGGAGARAWARCWAAIRLPTPSASGRRRCAPAAGGRRLQLGHFRPGAPQLRPGTHAADEHPQQQGQRPDHEQLSHCVPRLSPAHAAHASPAPRRPSLRGRQKNELYNNTRLARRLRRIHLMSISPRARVAGSRSPPSLPLPRCQRRWPAFARKQRA